MKLVAAKCPSCGANIKVDRSIKLTRCEYCNTEITVEEAVENLLKVELKDSPTFDNYLKLGNRYFDNSEHEEAYKMYSKAEEIDPDNPFIVLRKGLCKALISDYNNFDISSAINAMKTSYELMKKMKMDQKAINLSINDTGTTIFVNYQYLVNIYKQNKFNKEQSKGYVERLESCLKGYQYLDTIVENDTDLSDRILNSMIIIIDTILGNSNDSKYQLSSTYIKELNAEKKEYSNRRTKVLVKPHEIKKEKVIGVQNKASIIWDILCYINIFFLLIMFLGSIFTNESLLIIILWFLSIISFIPGLKRLLIKKYGSIMNTIVIILRILLLIGAFVALVSEPMDFENTYKGEDGSKIIIEKGKISIKSDKTEFNGTYSWESKNDDFYITIQNKNDNNKYLYHKTQDGSSLCLLENNECTTIYLPIN